MFLGAVFRVAVVAAFVLVSVAVPAQAEPIECVPGELRDKSVSVRTEDNVELPGLVLGSGPRGVVIGSYIRDSLCDWLPLARQLADDGHQVLLFPGRFGDPSLLPRGDDAYKFDLDVVAAAQELNRRGATSIVAGGDVAVAAGAVLAAPKIQGLVGLVLVSPLRGIFGRKQADARLVEPVLKTLTVPVYITSSDATWSNGQPSFEDGAREVAGMSANAELDIVSGASHGAELVKGDAALRDRVVAFVDEVQSKPWYERYMWLWTSAVLVIGLLGALLVFRLKHNRARAVSGDEARQALAAGDDDPAARCAR